LFLGIFALAISYHGPAPVELVLSYLVAGAFSFALLAFWKRARGVGRVINRSHSLFLGLVVVLGIVIEFF